MGDILIPTELSTFQNEALEACLLAGPLHIDFEIGLSYFAIYQNDLTLREKGFSIYEIGLAERRKSVAAAVISPLSAGFESIADAGLLRNGRLTTPGSIAHLKLSGFMRAESGLSNPGAQQLVTDFRSAYSNQHITSVILEVDSGGGETVAGDMIRNVISEANKPVLVYGWTVGSAAYNAATTANEIIASSPSARFGSLGAMYQVNKLLLEAIKASVIHIYGESAPNKNAPGRKALEGDFSGLQQEANLFTVDFQNSVRKLRPLKGSEEKIQNTLSGGMFFANEAKGNGLVDSIGNFNFAISRAKRWEKMSK